MRYAVILAGGWGERLWPMSTRERPKQLLQLSGDASLVSQTLRRIAPLVSVEDALVLTGAALKDRILDEVAPVPRERVVGEPEGRNTAPAIALAAKLLHAADPDASMAVLPADHVIADDAGFRDAISLAFEAAETGALVTLGIAPSRAETEYGYLKVGVPTETEGVNEVESFVEKPDAETARKYVSQGGYLWNGGIFVWRADRFLDAVRAHLPEVHDALSRVTSAPGDPGFAEDIERYYGSVPSISVDYGVMERAEKVVVVPCDFGWDDVGAWSALERVWPLDEKGNAVSGDGVVVDSTGCVIYSGDGIVAVVGLSDVIVARTPDATLVCPKDRAKDVRDIVKRLKERGVLAGARQGGSGDGTPIS